MSWDYFTHARTLELLYHKLQSPVLARYQMTQIELDVLLFLANHPGLDTAKDIVEIRRLTKSHVSAAVEGLSRKGYLLRVRRPDNRKLIPLSAVLGATFLLLIDTLARVLTSAELPLSILTGLIGAPFYFYLLLKQRMKLS